MKKKILLRVYTELNLGDDLFLKMILERYPTCEFYLNSNKGDYKKYFKDNTNLTVFSRKSYLSDLLVRFKGIFLKKFSKDGHKKFMRNFYLYHNKEYFDKANIFVSIGGSIFMQQKRSIAYWDIEYYKLVTSVFKGKGIFYIGCNFGPYLEESFKTEYNRIFKDAADICFREEKSFLDFKSLGNVRFHSDVVFGLSLKEQVKEQNTVGFSIISARNGIDELGYIKKYVELIEFYIDRGFKIFMFSFCKIEGDEDMIEKIIKDVRDSNKIERVFYNGDINAFLSRYAIVEKMYCSRFHAMILSMLYKQEIYPIVYSEKTLNVLNDINYKGNVIKIEDFKDIDIKEVFNKIKENCYDIEFQKRDAEKQFYALDKAINNC